MEVLVHMPSLSSPPDMVFWEDAGALRYSASIDTASTRHALVVVYSKGKPAPWNPWFHYLAELTPRPEHWNVYEVEDGVTPADFLTYLQS